MSGLNIYVYFYMLQYSNYLFDYVIFHIIFIVTKYLYYNTF